MKRIKYILTDKKHDNETVVCNSVGDVNVEIEDRFGDPDYAFEVQLLCEEASHGDKYVDENVIIEAVCV